MSHIQIAIDGPSGAGKSTLSRAVARELGIIYVDTGALYRTVGYYARSQGVSIDRIDEVVGMLDHIHIQVKYENGVQCVYLNGENLGDRIRENEISMYASAVGALPEVRHFLLETQKQIARENSVIMDGRDIGTVILPDADVKIFLTASDEARARRRCAELAEKGMPADYETVLADMIKRDKNDRERETAPAVAAEDAVLFDNSDMTFEESQAGLLSLIRTALEAEDKAAPADEPARRRRLNKKNARGKGYAVAHFFLAWIVRLVNGAHVHGKEHEPKRGEGAYLVICNHMKWYDPVLLSACLRQQQPHFMAKKEVFDVPVLRGLISSLGAYPVNRGGADVAAIKKTITMLEHGIPVGMFPQGHRNNGIDPRTTPPKPGCAMIAIKAGVPILPAYIKTKDFTAKPFRRKDVIFGELILPEDLHYDPTAPGEYNRIAAMLYERVCSLGDPAPAQGAQAPAAPAQTAPTEDVTHE